MDLRSGYMHLNAANEWPSFELQGLVIAPDGALALEVVATGGFATRGAWRAGPFQVTTGDTDWYRLTLDGARPDGAHFQVFTFATDGAGAPGWDPLSDDPFSDPGWHAAPRDVFDAVIAGEPQPRLWIGGVLRGDGSATPRLRQMRLDWGRRTYLAHLPALYAREDGPRDALERFLSLQESVLGRLESSIADLPLLFDAEAAPAQDWLSWLCGWVAFERSEAWSEDQARDYLAEAFALHARRGTPGALRRYLEMYAGVHARIEEPLQSARIWSLGETSALGFDTMLAFEPPEGAVLDDSALVDGSHITGTSASALPLFSDLAHRFCVKVHCGELRPGALEAARDVIEREKPGHTEAHLCIVEPRLRVGLQARVGIDAVVAGPSHARLGTPLGGDTLAARAHACVKQEEEEEE